MIRFNIIGTGFLDIADPSGIGFKAENQQFRFNEINLGRSTEFSVPATDYNRNLLGFGEDPAEWGAMLRASHPCQLVYDGGVKNGTLAVTSYDGGAFKCCFTVGNAEWIDALQEKKLADCVTTLQKVVWDSGETIVDADAAVPANGVELIKYEHPSYGNPWMVLPSVNVKTYIADILSNLGIPFYTTIDDAYWMIAPTLTGGSHDSFAIASTSMDNATITGQTENFLAVADVDIEWATVLLFQGGAVGGGDNPAKVFEALQGIKITFPSPMPTCYMVQWSRKLSRYKQLAGPDLAGKTINVPKGAKFFFASTPVYWTGYQDTFHPYSFTIEVDADGQMSRGDLWWMRNNAPDMTVFEFLKSVALATGMELLVDGEDGVKIVDGAYGTKDMEALEKVISIDSVARNVGSWGNGTKTAEIAFDSDEFVTDHITSDYGIDNEQLQDEKTYKTKFSEGNIGGSGIYVKDFDTSTYPYKLNAKKWTLAIALTPGVYLQRVRIPDPIGAEDIAVNSTCTKVKVLAGEAKFFDLPYSRVFTWRGSAYVWTDASWSDGVLSLTLQRVSQPEGMAVTPPPAPPKLVSIDASFNQGGALIIGTDSLDDLKQYLTVTAHYDDSSTRVLSDNEYTLSGTLAYPSATITVTFDGQTDTFTVAVEYDAQVEYIESTGTQRINIGISGNGEAVIDAQCANAGTTSRVLFGTLTSGNAGSWHGKPSTYSYWGFGTASNQLSTIPCTTRAVSRITLSSIGIDCYVNDEYIYRHVTSISQGSWTLFAAPGGSYAFPGKVFSFKGYQNSVLVRDFIPVRVGTTGYMYDRVSGTLFGNDGTGDFVIGNDV